MDEICRPFVFVGGSADGKRKKVPCDYGSGTPKYRYHCIGFAKEGKQPGEPVFFNEYYRAEMYRAGDTTAFIFIHEDLSPGEALTKLIEGYKGTQDG